MEIKRIEEFLVNFGKDVTKDVIECHSGDLSVICNPDTEWKEFIGMSIYNVVLIYCIATDKKCKFIHDDWDEDYLDSEEDI